MENEFWDVNEHQGKRKNQVEYSSGMASICFGLLIGILILILILN